MNLIQKAKNLGCTIKNDEYYLWEIQKWLRETYNIDISILIRGANSYTIVVHKNRVPLTKLIRKKWYKKPYNDTQYIIVDPTPENIKTGVYEETLEKGLQEALKQI